MITVHPLLSRTNRTIRSDCIALKVFHYGNQQPRAPHPMSCIHIIQHYSTFVKVNIWQFLRGGHLSDPTHTPTSAMLHQLVSSQSQNSNQAQSPRDHHTILERNTTRTCFPFVPLHIHYIHVTSLPPIPMVIQRPNTHSSQTLHQHKSQNNKVHQPRN